MTAQAQKRLAIGAAFAGVTLFVAANAHLLIVAQGSQPACAVVTGAEPARRDC